MKRFLSLALVAVMLVASLVISVNAKDPLGTVVELPHADNAPSMEFALPDASWGEKIIHIDGSSKNAGITQYKNPAKGGKVKQDLSFDLYGCWTDDAMYLCFVSPDPDFRGQQNAWWGDGIQMALVPGVFDISYCNGDWGITTKESFEDIDWCATFDVDDESVSCSYLADEHCVVYGDEKTNTLVVKFEMGARAMGYAKGAALKADDVFSFSMLRMDGSDEDPNNEAYVGWLEWGNFFDASKEGVPGITVTAANGSDTNSENPKTTTANTFKLVGGKATTPTQPETPVAPTEQPSDWAKAEVDAAIAAGLVPEALQKGYKDGTSRETLSKLLSVLLDKVYGKAPEKTDAKFSDTTDADVLKAANLGIINGYANGDGTFNFKPANTLKRSEMTAIINRVAKLCGKTVEGFDAEVKFSDTASHWCNKELGWAVHQGIVKGTSATTFSPENTLTVEQSIMMIYRTFEALK